MPVRRAVRRLRPYARQASAAALGYIAGGLPGAYIGTRMARRSGGRRNNAPKYQGTTTQRDAVSVYKRKRMPAKKRKQWKSFVKKVKAATTDRGKLSLVFNGQHAEIRPNLVAGVAKQALVACHLYGRNAVGKQPNEIGGLDMAYILQQAVSANEPTLDDTSKITFRSAVLDITVSNVQINPTDYLGPLEVDAYHVIYPGRKEVNGNGIITEFQVGTNQTEAAVSLPKVDLDDRGVTPFAIGQTMSNTGLKIISKKKYFLGINQSFTMQIRDPKNRVINVADMNSKTCWYKPGMTQTILLVAKPTGLISSEANFTLLTSATRSFTLEWEGLLDDRSHYGNNLV